jgi:hypothetical protein
MSAISPLKSTAIQYIEYQKVLQGISKTQFNVIAPKGSHHDDPEFSREKSRFYDSSQDGIQKAEHSRFSL